RRPGLLGARQRGQFPVSPAGAPGGHHRGRNRGFSPPEKCGAASGTAARKARLMLIARVIGELVATQKHASHEARKLLLVQPFNLDGTARGDAVVALDAVDAGAGDRVLLATEGFSAMTSVGRPNSPI